MASGNGIVVNASPKGRFDEGYITGAIKPGTCLQFDVSEAVQSGRFTYEPYAPGTDGNRRPIIVLLPDVFQGKLATDAYVSGDRCKIYHPSHGDELNMLAQDVSGTGDDVAVGDLFIVDTGTGKIIATTGTPESEPFLALEAVTDPTADHLLHCLFTGY